MSPNPRVSTINVPHTRRRFLQAAGAGVALSLTSAAVPAAEPAPAPPARGKSLHLGIASYTFRKFDLDKTLAMTRRAGLEYVCLKEMHLPLKSTPDEIAAAAAKVKEAGLVLYGCGVVSMRKPEDVQPAFEYAKAAGMKRIIAAPDPALLPLLNDKVQQYDIAICIHNHGPTDKTFPTPQSAYEKLGGLDKRMGLCIDIGHTVRVGADLVAATRACADRVLDIHIKDVTEATAKGRCIQMGRGVIDIPAFLRTLLEINYAGVVSYEYEIEDTDPLPGLAESVGYTRGVLAML